ncbi:microcephalin-like isoform X1 [Biomphalaria glabrata]|uniref:Microcephalin-like isoform X1 n=1 Tax=Biomphalaria glabrata TaxID=6526 RepID=A0A9W3AGH4_BIOGL|nr:microcephalin-like isoform X1 [Biomphalaria glabrata]XP_055886394.1 microcephalin-like isoform X1 [Biomphalaria glabrata]XP_055886395.1 microcephalin-like isoform X1 [Biomphalaria glabrata]XP_055886396.1 microcephalin-like isoform X1 [Biomphalaria glabrata]
MDLNSILKGIVAYVEVRSNNDNRSAAVYKELEFLGSEIRTSFSDDVTHVVFKEGLKRTWNKARKRNVPLVSVSWLESCRQNYKKMPEIDFPALMPEEIFSPLPKFNQGPRWKKMKSMQPNDFDEEIARSAERAEKRRKRDLMANRFKIKDDSTPTSSSPHAILAMDTQARSPYVFPPLINYCSPVPETPSSLKERLEKMLRDQREVLELDPEEPLITPKAQVEKPLQRRLFGGDLVSSSSEDSIVTSRIIQGVIDKLDKTSSNESIKEKLSPQSKRLATRDCVNNAHLSPKHSRTASSTKLETSTKKKSFLSLKSPHRISAHTNQSENIFNTLRSTICSETKKFSKPLSPQDFNIATSPVTPLASHRVTDKHGVSLKDYQLNPPVTSLSALLCVESSATNALCFDENCKTLKSSNAASISSFGNVDKVISSALHCNLEMDPQKPECDSKLPVTVDTTTLKPKLTRKKNLLSGCQQNAFFDKSTTPGDEMSSTKSLISLNNKLDDSLVSAKADASFLFSLGVGPDKNTSRNNKLKNKRSKASQKPSSKFSPDKDLSSTNVSTSQEKSCSEMIRPSCTQDDTVSRNPLEASMSVMYPSETSQIIERKSRRRSVRLSTDELLKINQSERDNSFKKSHNKAIELPLAEKCNRRRSTRLSINEFSFKNSHLQEMTTSEVKPSKSVIKVQQKVTETVSSSYGSSTESRKDSKRKRSRSSSSTKKSEKKKRKKTNSSTSEENPSIKLNSSSTADIEEGTTSQLRHARSLILAKPDVLGKRDKYSLVMTSLHRDEQEVVCSVVKTFGVFHMTRNVESCTTHIVCGDARRTLNILKAITRGCWILKKNWVLESLEAGNWLLEEKYEMELEFPAAKKSRLQREKCGHLYKLDLLSKIGPIYVYNDCTPPRQELVHLINLCCGNVTGSLTRASIFVGDSYDPKRLVIRPTWILDSIMRLETLNPSDYIVSPPVSASQRENSPEF